jgi:hypothetical protein
MMAEAFGERRLIWLGYGGEDAQPLTALPQFTHCYALHSPLRAEGVESLAVESFTGLRGAELDIPSFLGEQGKPLVDSFAEAVSRPSLLTTYAPYEFTPFLLASGKTQYLGNSHVLYLEVSDKPVVEQALSGHPDFATIPWRRLPDGPGRRAALFDALGAGPVVLRGSEQGGGAGHELVRDASALATSTFAAAEGPVQAAPYLEGYLPVCVGACVFGDGGVTVHTPSLQLVGIPECTSLDFGFCGNDFGAAAGLDRRALDRLETCTRAAGEWLHTRGFLGAFGVDALVRGDEVVFVEINARFLGSSCLSAEAGARMDHPDVYLDHLMACLELPSHPSAPLAVQAACQAPLSHVLCTNRASEPLMSPAEAIALPSGFTATRVPAPSVRVAPDSLLLAVRAEKSVTRDGFSLSTEAATAVASALAGFRPAA